jgi:hypothetical protein
LIATAIAKSAFEADLLLLTYLDPGHGLHRHQQRYRGLRVALYFHTTRNLLINCRRLLNIHTIALVLLLKVQLSWPPQPEDLTEAIAAEDERRPNIS